MRRVDRLGVFGDAEADELLGVAMARVQRAMREEGAEPGGGGGAWETITGEGDGPAVD